MTWINKCYSSKTILYCNRFYSNSMLTLLASRLLLNIMKKRHWFRCCRNKIKLLAKRLLFNIMKKQHWFRCCRNNMMLLELTLSTLRHKLLWQTQQQWPLQQRWFRNPWIRLNFNRPFLNALDKFSVSSRSLKRSYQTELLSQSSQKLLLRNGHYLKDL